MEFLPLFFDLKKQAVLIVGGGEVALRKARMLKKAGAKIKRAEMMKKAKGHLRYLGRKAGEKMTSAKKKVGKDPRGVRALSKGKWGYVKNNQFTPD